MEQEVKVDSAIVSKDSPQETPERKEILKTVADMETGEIVDSISNEHNKKKKISTGCGASYENSCICHPFSTLFACCVRSPKVSGFILTLIASFFWSVRTWLEWVLLGMLLDGWCNDAVPEGLSCYTNPGASVNVCLGRLNGKCERSMGAAIGLFLLIWKFSNALALSLRTLPRMIAFVEDIPAMSTRGLDSAQEKLYEQPLPWTEASGLRILKFFGVGRGAAWFHKAFIIFLGWAFLLISDVVQPFYMASDFGRIFLLYWQTSSRRIWEASVFYICCWYLLVVRYTQRDPWDDSKADQTQGVLWFLAPGASNVPTSVCITLIVFQTFSYIFSSVCALKLAIDSIGFETAASGRYALRFLSQGRAPPYVVNGFKEPVNGVVKLHVPLDLLTSSGLSEILEALRDSKATHLKASWRGSGLLTCTSRSEPSERILRTLARACSLMQDIEWFNKVPIGPLIKGQVKTIEGGTGESLGMKVVLTRLRNALSITHIRLHNTKFDDECCRLLGMALCLNDSIVDIDLSNNRVTDVGISYIADAIRGHPNLKSLNLAKNMFGKHGARTLAAALLDIQGLEKLVVTDNDLGAAGWAAFQVAIRENPYLGSILVAWSGSAKATAFGGGVY